MQLSDFTKGNDEEAHVAQPIGGLDGQGLDKEPKDGTQVTLASHSCHFDWSWHGGVAVAAGEKEDLHTLRLGLTRILLRAAPSSHGIASQQPQQKSKLINKAMQGLKKPEHFQEGRWLSVKETEELRLRMSQQCCLMRAWLRGLGSYSVTW